MLRLAWITGIISTPEYNSRKRRQQFGPAVIEPSETALDHLERRLLEDRIAVVLFLVAFIVLAYTLFNAPMFAK